jgi:hypothetical protein
MSEQSRKFLAWHPSVKRTAVFPAELLLRQPIAAGVTGRNIGYRSSRSAGIFRSRNLRCAIAQSVPKNRENGENEVGENDASRGIGPNV